MVALVDVPHATTCTMTTVTLFSVSPSLPPSLYGLYPPNLATRTIVTFRYPFEPRTVDFE